MRVHVGNGEGGRTRLVEGGVRGREWVNVRVREGASGRGCRWLRDEGESKIRAIYTCTSVLSRNLIFFSPLLVGTKPMFVEMTIIYQCTCLLCHSREVC